MGPVRWVLGHAGYYDHGAAFVAADFDTREGLLLGGAVDAGDRPGGTAFALIPEPQRLRLGLLGDDDVLRLWRCWWHLFVDYTNWKRHEERFLRLVQVQNGVQGMKPCRANKRGARKLREDGVVTFPTGFGVWWRLIKRLGNMHNGDYRGGSQCRTTVGGYMIYNLVVHRGQRPPFERVKFVE